MEAAESAAQHNLNDVRSGNAQLFLRDCYHLKDQLQPKAAIAALQPLPLPINARFEETGYKASQLSPSAV